MLAAVGLVPLVLAAMAFFRLVPEWVFIAAPRGAWMMFMCGGVPLGLGLVLCPVTRRLAAGPAWWIPLAILALGWVAWWNLLDPFGSERFGYTFLNQGGLVSMAGGCALGLAVNVAALYAPSRQKQGGSPLAQ